MTQLFKAFGAEIPEKQQGSRRGFYRSRAVEKRWT
jgi:hypothetical protein